jgi:exopolysaccharide biosynthesis polyprenyl glycosylphosphotransferase
MHQRSGVLRIRGLILPENSKIEGSAHAVPVLGTTNCLAEVINRERLNSLILLEGSMSESELHVCNDVSRRMGIAVSCAVGFATTYERAHFTIRDGIPLVELTPISFSLWQEFVKRALDVTLAVSLLVILAPLMIAIAILIKLTSNGPIFYKSPRVGKGGRHFTFLKFRSMEVASDLLRSALQNEKNGHLFKLRNDPRVTPVGKILRRYSLDELPQLVNVLRGEMSIVGPRPLPAEDLDPDGMSRRFALWAEQRSRVHPGITGLWQIHGRSDLEFEEMIRFDLEYIQNWSLLGDFRILLATPAFVLNGAGAY